MSDVKQRMSDEYFNIPIAEWDARERGKKEADD